MTTQISAEAIPTDAEIIEWLNVKVTPKTVCPPDWDGGSYTTSPHPMLLAIRDRLIALDAAQAAPVVPEWQPIETAPKKDAIRILVTHFPATTKPPIVITHWGSVRINNYNHKCWKRTRFKPLDWEPTHWMPLPEPPATKITTWGQG